VCHPELDWNPLSHIETLEQVWQDAGGEIAVTVYQGERHAFGHHPGPAADRFVDDLAAFLTRFV
jgi:hypothetical protein